jgi:hypothetical protein
MQYGNFNVILHSALAFCWEFCICFNLECGFHFSWLIYFSKLSWSGLSIWPTLVWWNQFISALSISIVFRILWKFLLIIKSFI